MEQTKKQLFWEIFRFLLVGGTATLVDYFVFWLFDGQIFPLLSDASWWQTLSLSIATALGFCTGLVVNWVLSVRFVFRQVEDENKVRTKKAFAVFACIGLVGLVVTEIGVLLLVGLLPDIPLFGRTAVLGTSWAKWLARVLMTCVVLVWSYVGRKVFVFK